MRFDNVLYQLQCFPGYPFDSQERDQHQGHSPGIVQGSVGIGALDSSRLYGQVGGCACCAGQGKIGAAGEFRELAKGVLVADDAQRFVFYRGLHRKEDPGPVRTGGIVFEGGYVESQLELPGSPTGGGA